MTQVGDSGLRWGDMNWSRTQSLCHESHNC